MYVCKLVTHHRLLHWEYFLSVFTALKTFLNSMDTPTKYCVSIAFKQSDQPFTKGYLNGSGGERVVQDFGQWGTL